MVVFDVCDVFVRYGVCVMYLHDMWVICCVIFCVSFVLDYVFVCFFALLCVMFNTAL